MHQVHVLGSAADGGAETYFSDLTQAMAQSGLSISCAIRPHPARQARLTDAAIPHKLLPFGGTMDLFTTARLGRWLKAQQADVVVSWMNRAARHTPAGPWKRIGRLGGYYDLKYYRGFDALVGNTEDIRDWIVAQGWPAERAFCIPNFAAIPVRAQPVPRARFETPEDVPLLLGMGRLHPSKAHDVTLRALAEIPQAFLWIAGSGSQEDALKALARDLGVAERVRFLGWQEDASGLYAAADLCLFPSRFEPLGNVVIQCWAHDLAVVAARAKGPGMLIRHGQDGMLINIDDAAALAAVTRRLLADPAARRELASAGRARVEAEFAPDRVLARWTALFELLKGR